MHLYKLAILSVFGQKGAHPLRTAIWRLAGLHLGSAGLSVLLGLSLHIPDLPHVLPVGYVAFAVAIAAQATVLFALSTASGILHSQGALERLLVYWPLSPWMRWSALLLPSSIVTLLALLLISVPLGAAAVAFGLHPLPYALSLVTGGFLGLCLFSIVPFRYIWIMASGFVGLLGIEYKALQIATYGSVFSANCVILLACAGAACIIWRFFTGQHRLAAEIIRPKRLRRAQLTSHTDSLWLAKATWRSPAYIASFTTAALLSTGAAIGATIQPIYSPICVFAVTVLIATCISDLRAIQRLKNPPEITLLKGTTYFVFHELAIATGIALLLSTPLLFTISLDADIASQIAAATGIGLYTGTLLVPGPRDIAGQSLATFLCISSLVAPNILPMPFLEHTTASTLFYLGITVCFAAASFVVEYKRNAFTWRKHAT